MLSVKTNITAMILVVACALGQALQVWADRPPREFGVMANSDDMRRTPVARLAGMMKAIGYTSVAVSCKPEQFEMNMKAYRDAGI
ncbi:MAG: hypothetical protein JW818_14540, partial [Pirellulales bacterium]|nr:hypothetical protein [Pirellulales bacterium]